MAYRHQILDDINLPSILRLPWVTESWPYHKSNFFDLFTKPSIAYTYQPPLGVMICNYKKFVAKLDDFDHFNCECSTSPYRDPHHNHICTGDLSFVKTGELRRLLSRGFNYKPREALDVKAVESDLDAAINEYVNTIKKRFRSFDELDLVPWVTEIQREFLLRLAKFGTYFYHVDPQINDFAEMRRIKHRFVITPIDKASNNFAFICKNLYAEKLREELGSSTYEQDNTCSVDLLDQLRQDLMTMGVDDDSKNLPFMYLIPKCHKNPIRFRPIVSSKNCISKSLSRLVGYGLQFALKRVRRFDKSSKPYRYSCNECWIIDDNQPILSWLNTIDKCHKSMEIRTYDFENLYTTLPHNKVKQRLGDVIDKVFYGCYQFLNVSLYHRCLSTSQRKDYEMCFSRVEYNLQAITKSRSAVQP